MTDNWYFVLPNLHGILVDGKSNDGVAVKICHDSAISWNAHIIRHCTSLSRLDGVGTNVVGSANGMVNQLYGTFTCANERLVNAWRKRAKMVQRWRNLPTQMKRLRILRHNKESW